MSDNDLNERKLTELERSTRLRGFRFGLHEFMAEVDLDGLTALNDDLEASYLAEGGTLDRKTKELLIICACIGLGDSSTAHLQLHMHAAHEAGATPQQILDAIRLVERWTGEVRRIPALEAWRATFRPDAPTIDRVAELRHRHDSQG